MFTLNTIFILHWFYTVLIYSLLLVFFKKASFLDFNLRFIFLFPCKTLNQIVRNPTFLGFIGFPNSKDHIFYSDWRTELLFHHQLLSFGATNHFCCACVCMALPFTLKFFFPKMWSEWFALSLCPFSAFSSPILSKIFLLSYSAL